jgi:hypothetical protein
LNLLREEFEEKIRNMREFNKVEFRKAVERMVVIEESVKKEIHDRVIESDEAIYVVKNDLSGIHMI